MIIDKTVMDKFKIAFTGDIILPGDKSYEQASKVLMRKGTPAIVVRPKSPADVAQAIKLAKENKLIISVRSGGHSGPGLSTNDDGLVIDLKHLNDVAVIDKSNNVVRVGAGATWATVAEALQPLGLSISSGDTRSVGVGGIALCGGIGWMVREYGLVVDNIQAVELVTADGRVVRTSATEEPELFWAVRGGGGNFGVATSFDIATHPKSSVYAGSLVYNFDDMKPVLRGWRDYMRTAPEELTTMFLVMPSIPAFGGRPASITILCCYAGNENDAAAKALQPLRELATLVSDDVQEKPYTDILEDAHVPQDVKIVTNNAFVKELNDEVIDAICEHKNQILQIRSLGGAVDRVAADATAFAHRGNEVLVVSPVFLPPDASDTTIRTALEPWRQIAGFSNGAYANFFTDDGEAEVHASYPEATYKRLAKIKKQYDPDNIFNQNYNIKPAN